MPVGNMDFSLFLVEYRKTVVGLNWCRIEELSVDLETIYSLHGLALMDLY